MKNFIVALTLLCLSFATQAHYITPIGCGTNGRIKVIGTYFDYAGSQLDSVFLYITTNNQSNGPIKWSGSIFVTSGGDWNMDTLPLFASGEKVYIKEYERSRTNKPFSLLWTGSTTINSTCSAMPVTLTSWTANISDKDKSIVNLAWSVDMESNVAYYRIDASTDNGKTWDSVASIKSKVSGNTSLKTDYAYDFTNPLVNATLKTSTAKNESNTGTKALGVALAFAVIAISMRSKAMTGVACLLIFASVACKKSVDAPAQKYKYNAFRLSNVDIDGQSKTFEVRTIRY